MRWRAPRTRSSTGSSERFWSIPERGGSRLPTPLPGGVRPDLGALARCIDCLPGGPRAAAFPRPPFDRPRHTWTASCAARDFRRRRSVRHATITSMSDRPISGDDAPAAPWTARHDPYGEVVASRYEELSAAMFTPEEIDPAVDFLAGLAWDGRVLEFGIGTGRLALPP